MLTALLIGSVLMAATGSAMSAYTNYQNNKMQEAAYKYNAKVAENQAIQTQMEKSVSIDQQREEARRRIASGRAAMAAGGNVGPAAQAAEMDSWGNLDEDLAYTNWNYDTKSQSFKQQAALDRYSAKVYSGNAVNSLVAGGLNTIGAIGQGISNMYGAGLIGGGGMSSFKNPMGGTSYSAGSNNMTVLF